jgi:farnesyl diphosphate synthase
VGENDALPAACALECVHCYSLVHDDLPSMDDDALRRGRPTLHLAFDEATAILAGDALLTLAFEMLSDPRTHEDPAIRSELVFLLAKAGGWQGMAQGQALDLSPNRQAFGAADIAAMQALKTGALFRFACLDAQGDAAALGKAVAKDEARGKATLVALLGVEAAKRRLAALVAEAETAVKPFGAKAAALIAAARFIAERRA